jgi:hypothetical protein
VSSPAPSPPGLPRPPVALGCFGILAAILVVGLGLGLLVVFLESGSDDGHVRLDVLEAYAPGSVTRFAESGFYLVRLAGGDLLALSDLDAANRARTDGRCRVGTIGPADPEQPALMARYAASFSPSAEGTAFFFREDCLAAVYDVSGLRLDGPGRNLDRHPVEIDDEGHVVVNVARRTCSARDGAELFAATECTP